MYLAVLDSMCFFLSLFETFVSTLKLKRNYSSKAIQNVGIAWIFTEKIMNFSSPMSIRFGIRWLVNFSISLRFDFGPFLPNEMIFQHFPRSLPLYGNDIRSTMVNDCQRLSFLRKNIRWNRITFANSQLLKTFIFTFLATEFVLFSNINGTLCVFSCVFWRRTYFLETVHHFICGGKNCLIISYHFQLLRMFIAVIA